MLDRNEYIKKLMDSDDRRSLSETAELFKQHAPDVLKTFIPTGFPVLDKTLGGGLTAGVHYMGAISSLGKSTFAIQMAFYMASHGRRVVYASLEMRKVDIVAKLISMLTMLEVAPRFTNPGASGHYDVRDHETIEKAKSSHALTSKDEMAQNTADDWKLIEKCAETVANYGRNINILESLTHPMSIDDIELYMEAYYQKYGVAPVLFVDYLQILTPSEAMRKSTDKQAIDDMVARFRTIAAKYNTPVVVISSFNRAGYDTPVSMQDFKESGNIEYSADTLLAFQLKGVGDKSFNPNDAKKEHPRKVELVVLKQRYGPSGEKIDYLFSTTYNYFDEVGISTAPAKRPVK